MHFEASGLRDCVVSCVLCLVSCACVVSVSVVNYKSTLFFLNPKSSGVKLKVAKDFIIKKPNIYVLVFRSDFFYLYLWIEKK